MAVPRKGAGDRRSRSARSHNQLVAAANAHEQQSSRRFGPLDAGHSQTTAYVVNNTGQIVYPFQAMAIECELIGNAKWNQPWQLNGVLPTAAHAGRIAIASQRINVGGVGICTISGLCHAVVDDVDCDNPTYDLTPGALYLSASANGSAMLLTSSNFAGGSVYGDNGLGVLINLRGGGSSNGSTIRFSIYESTCDTCTAIGEVLSRPDGVAAVTGEYTLPEVNDDARKFVDLTDKLGAYLNEPDHILAGRMGYATYLDGPAFCTYQELISWEIIALAEQQTECEV